MFKNLGIFTAATVLALSVPAAADEYPTKIENGWISTTGEVIAESDQKMMVIPSDAPNEVVSVARNEVVVPQDVEVGDTVTVIGEVEGTQSTGAIETTGVLVSNHDDQD